MTEEQEPPFLTDGELYLSAMIVEQYAAAVVGDDRIALLEQVRKFAGTVGGRQYIYGWEQGRESVQDGEKVQDTESKTP